MVCINTFCLVNGSFHYIVKTYVILYPKYVNKENGITLK